jgi:hypothetical protein
MDTNFIAHTFVSSYSLQFAGEDACAAIRVSKTLRGKAAVMLRAAHQIEAPVRFNF